MANFFKDFMQPAKVIFDRLDQQKNKRIIVNGNDGSNRSGANVPPPYYPELPEYPCKLIRDSNGKVIEVQYGEDPRGYVWRQILHRDATGKVDYIKQENPDGSFNVVLNRSATTGKLDNVDLE